MEAPSSPPLPLSSSDDEGDISQLGAVPTSMLSSPVRVGKHWMLVVMLVELTFNFVKAPTSQLGMSDDEDDIRVQTSQSQSQSQWDSQGQYQDGIPLSPEASPPPSPLDPHDLGGTSCKSLLQRLEAHMYRRLSYSFGKSQETRGATSC